jgi:oligopeptide/dipeptide ABC transporter ATP-binding protein
MVFQDPMSSLNPLKPVGVQVAEVLRHQKGFSRRAALDRAAELFELVGIPEPKRRLRQYPFELSGGMAQRVVIATALAPEGTLLVADEPTTALDVIIQAQILELIARLRDDLGLAMILISHDLGVVAGMADRIAVMYAGRIVEEGSAEAVFSRPQHPYTIGLIASSPDPFHVRKRLEPIPGSPPSVPPWVAGCAFADRCTRATEICTSKRPRLDAASTPGDLELNPSHKVACWHAS